MNKKLLISLGLVVSLPFLAACSDDDADESADENSAEQEPAAPEPDLESIPDVVAVVNGEEILKEDFVPAYESQFQQFAMQAQATGEDVDEEQLKQQTADNMVSNELLLQEADNRNVDASQEEIDQTLNDLATQNGLESADEFIAALEEQGMAEDEVMAQLENQVKLDELIADEAGDTEPTEKELRELYEQAEAQQGQAGEEAPEMPPFEEVKPQLEEQAKAEKESAAAEELVGKLREDAEVTINL
ncbi:peptidylprolyl isomerase [Phytoactinopolyspora halotolerans]|uniref:Peptidylprolyl isomerase n=1 Tax=Phytoactinopolyspora halotolerans TaxID=1981512 RepID=A0A6L9SCI2_9ACTN|nr:peptidylprolyl isomerase [Phytoactinopolyspora halotolerans]